MLYVSFSFELVELLIIFYFMILFRCTDELSADLPKQNK